MMSKKDHYGNKSGCRDRGNDGGVAASHEHGINKSSDQGVQGGTFAGKSRGGRNYGSPQK